MRPSEEGRKADPEGGAGTSGAESAGDAGGTEGAEGAGAVGATGATALTRLTAVLSAARGGGHGPAASELAELLWLARHMSPAPRPRSPAGTADGGSAPGAARRPAAGGVGTDDPYTDDPYTATEDDTRPEPGTAQDPESAPASAPLTSGRVPLHLPAGHGRGGAADRSGGDDADADPAASTRPGGVGGVGLHVPVPPMIPHPLALQRALRPLGRKVPAPLGQVLDEEATAHRIAALGARPGAWLPVLRPADERWLRLCLVYDDGPTMPVWRPLVRELHATLAQSGLFRTVELHRADPDGTVPARAAAAPGTGRTVVLLISDCMGPQWREGPAGRRWYRTLRRWAARLPLAVLQPLPERLWATTALPAAPGLLAAPHAAAPAAAYSFTPYAADAPPPRPKTLPVPVVEASPAWLAHWSSLVADVGGRRVPGAVGRLGTGPAAASAQDGVPREDVTLLSAEELVLRFRSTASPEAFRLAGHLAVGEPYLPVMRLVQAAVERRPRAQHLAEVILSGMLTTAADGPPGAYAFRDGVRAVLLGTLPRSGRGRTRQLLARVGALIDERAGVAPGELRAVARGVEGGPGSGAGTPPQAAAAEPFATVTEDSVRHLTGGRTDLVGGRYRLVRRMGAGQDEWLAEDTRRRGATVVVRRHPRPAQWLRAGFRDAARQLGLFRHPHVAAVIDHGVDGDVPYVVREFVDGRSLAHLIRRSPHGLPAVQLTALVPPLADAVTTLHAHGLAHGALHAWNVISTENGPILTGLDAPRAGPWAQQADLRALGRLVADMFGESATRGAVHQPPLPLDDFVLPEALLRELRSAVTDLASDTWATQLRGADRLVHLAAPEAPRRTYALLGPLGVTRGGKPLIIGPPAQRAVLCMLALHEGGTVPYEHLVAGLWESDPPADGVEHVLAYASRLRNTLGPGSVAHRDGGFALVVDPDDIDVARFRRLAAEAEEARTADDFVRARVLLGAALALWRGEPLQRVTGPAADDARTALRRLRVTMLRSRAELGLAMREYEETAAELRTVLQEFPDDDVFSSLLRDALRRQQREDETPAAYRTVRAALGTEPSAELRALHRRLTEKEAPGTDTSAPAPAPVPMPTPTHIAFAFAVRPGWQADTLMKLSRSISRLLTQGGAAPEQFELLPRDRGWDAAVSPDVPRAALVAEILRELPFTLDGYPGLGLLVTVGDAPEPTGPLLTGPVVGGGGAVVVVPGGVRDELAREGRADGVRFAPVPESDAWFCHLEAAGAAARQTVSLSASLAYADTVVLGFDGTLTRLYSSGKAREAAMRLVALVVRARDPEAALEGAPLPRPPAGTNYVHPLDVLRAFAHEGSLAAELADQLDHVERQAAHGAKAVARSSDLVRLLTDGTHARARTLCVVTDTAPRAVSTYLTTHGLVASDGPGGIAPEHIHCRTADLTRLLPDPDRLRRALERAGTPPERSLMIGSTVAEAKAAGALGVPFIGYAPDDRARERLLGAGARHTVSALARIIAAAGGS